MNNFINKKSANWIMLGCAIFIGVYNFIDAISANAFSSFVCLLWNLAVVGLIIYGLCAKKENYFNCGLFLSLPFAITAFGNAWTQIDSAINVFDYSAVYGIMLFCLGLATLGVATAFVLWILNKFFKVKTNKLISEIAIYCAAGFYFLGFIFMIITAIAEDYVSFGFAGYLAIISNIAYLGLFTAYLYKDEPAPIKEKPAKKDEEKTEEKVEDSKNEEEKNCEEKEDAKTEQKEQPAETNEDSEQNTADSDKTE